MINQFSSQQPGIDLAALSKGHGLKPLVTSLCNLVVPRLYSRPRHRSALGALWPSGCISSVNPAPGSAPSRTRAETLWLWSQSQADLTSRGSPSPTSFEGRGKAETLRLWPQSQTGVRPAQRPSRAGKGRNPTALFTKSDMGSPSPTSFEFSPSCCASLRKLPEAPAPPPLLRPCRQHIKNARAI